MSTLRTSVRPPLLQSIQNLCAAASALALFAVSAATVGCGGSAVTPVTTQPPAGNYTGTGFSGHAFAGKQPLIGASVQVYAAGTTGNGSGSSAVLASALTTDSNGAFTVASGYFCPAANSQLYVVAKAGKPGASASSSNSAITFVTAIGACNQITSSTQVALNEVTTVADAYALSQFFSAGAVLGATSTNTIGLQNAIATAAALADPSAGASPGPTFPSNGASPAPFIDTLANLLNACAASTSGSACSSLFSATTPSGGSAPSDTFDAILNLVRKPAASVSTLYTLSAASSAFTPALSAAPSDWTLHINYTGGGMDAPSGLGIDSQGNVWVANYFNVASVFSPIGKPLIAQGITGSGLSASWGLAVDTSDHAWIPNEPSTGNAGDSVSLLDTTGKSYAGTTGFTAGGLDYPVAVAIDTDSSAWIVDYGNSHLTHLSSSGQALSGASGYTSTQLAFPVAAAIDTSHNVWIANQSNTGSQTSYTVTRVSPDGSQFTSYTCCDAPSDLAIDQHGNVWVTNYYGDSISEISASGNVLSTGYTGGGLAHPQGIAIDAAGNVWIANYRGPSITELAGASAGSTAAGTTLSPAAGFGPDAALSEAYAIVIDSSGNLWVSNFGNNILTEFVGMAAPVKTPLIGPVTAP